MADYKATTAEFQSVANAIRTKGGTSGQLVWPTGFVSAVQAIPTGGGGSSEFEGDGREYLFDWSFTGYKGFVHVTKDGQITIINDDAEINGEFLYKAANSQVVTAKKNCYAKIGTTSTLGNETQFSTNDIISSGMTGFDRLVVAYGQSGEVSEFEIGVGWYKRESSGWSLQRCILKVNDILSPQASGTVIGAVISLPTMISYTVAITSNPVIDNEVFTFCLDGSAYVSNISKRNGNIATGYATNELCVIGAYGTYICFAKEKS